MKRSLFVVLALLAAPSLRADIAEKELERFQGKWAVVRIEENGVKEPDDEAKKFSITVKGNTFHINLDGREETIAFSIDPSKSPKSIDMTPHYGDDKDKLTPGIYELNGDELRICACPKGDRPAKIASEKGTLILVLKRENK